MEVHHEKACYRRISGRCTSWRLLLLRLQNQSARCRYPPQENADGTIDYTLFHQGIYDRSPYFWVMRLPADQYVWASEAWSANYKGSGGSYGFRTRPNEYITVYFKDETLTDYMTKTQFKDDVSSKDYISITFRTFEFSFTLNGQVQFPVHMDERIARDCRVLEQPVPGLTRYVNAVDRPKPGERCGALEDPVGKSTYNILRKADGSPVAGFDCIEGRASNGSSRCAGYISPGGVRWADFSFWNPHFINRMPQLQANLEAYVKRVSIRNEMSDYTKKRLEDIKAWQKLK
jgi:hypothetical protein